MKGHLIAALAGIAALLAMWGVAQSISSDRPTNPKQAEIVENAVAAITPSFRGEECANVASSMPVALVRDADALIREARQNPAALVPSPSQEDEEIELREVPGILAGEITRCIGEADSVGPGWKRLVTRLEKG